jgi:uncharacterized membrane protein YqjE
VFLIEETGRPEWGLVKIGRVKSRTTLVPLIKANPVEKGVKLAYEKKVVEDAPPIDADGEPSEQQVNAVYRHYDIDPGEGQSADGSKDHDDVPAGRPQHGDLAVNGAARPSSNGVADLRDEPISDLVKQVSDEAKTLVSQEIKLAKVEMADKAKEVGIGAGMFGGAGYFGHLAALGLMLTIIFALATFMPAWVAALIVTIVFGAAAGALALIGKKRIQQAGPPIPEQTVESVKQTIETVKEEAKWGLGQTR